MPLRIAFLDYEEVGPQALVVKSREEIERSVFETESTYGKGRILGYIEIEGLVANVLESFSDDEELSHKVDELLTTVFNFGWLKVRE